MSKTVHPPCLQMGHEWINTVIDDMLMSEKSLWGCLCQGHALTGNSSSKCRTLPVQWISCPYWPKDDNIARMIEKAVVALRVVSIWIRARSDPSPQLLKSDYQHCLVWIMFVPVLSLVTTNWSLCMLKFLPLRLLIIRVGDDVPTHLKLWITPTGTKMSNLSIWIDCAHFLYNFHVVKLSSGALFFCVNSGILLIVMLPWWEVAWFLPQSETW